MDNPGGHDSPRRVDNPAIWSDPDTMETLDLCLSCKACKTECPSNVDIARLKAEYTAQRYKATGHIPLRARVLGHIRTVNRFGSIVPGIANRINRLAPARWIMNRVLGLAPQRTIPEFAHHRLNPALFEQVPTDGPIIAIYADCFTMYNEPGIAHAARAVLRQFGYQVKLIDAGCCGRSMISTGLLEDAIASADAGLVKLRPFITDSDIRAILVCEPSCLAAIKDDWLQLRLRTPRQLREQLAAKSWLVEEFLDKQWDQHPRRPEAPNSADQPEVMLHGHCHQKALWGSESSAGLLRRLVGDRLTVLDSGCCGMAGSFGYTASHYDLSMKIGELVLFPAVRQAGGAAITAPGTSCRHQIRDGTGSHAMHPIELCAKLLGLTDSPM